jgi:uncharacterized protein (DUF2141 family)
VRVFFLLLAQAPSGKRRKTLIQPSPAGGRRLWRFGWNDVSLKPALLCLAALPLLVSATSNGSIEVAVNNIRSARGKVHVDICTRATFLNDCPYVGEASAHIGTTVVAVHNIPPGIYAAQATHDANGNNKVDKGLFGIPKEGVGFSNDALHFSEPKFDDAAFRHDSGDQKISVGLKYFFR